jgi:hypothetical protein
MMKSSVLGTIFVPNELQHPAISPGFWGVEQNRQPVLRPTFHHASVVVRKLGRLEPGALAEVRRKVASLFQ